MPRYLLSASRYVTGPGITISNIGICLYLHLQEALGCIWDFNIDENLKIDLVIYVTTHNIKKGDQTGSCLELVLMLVWNLSLLLSPPSIFTRTPSQNNELMRTISTTKTWHKVSKNSE